MATLAVAMGKSRHAKIYRNDTVVVQVDKEIPVDIPVDVSVLGKDPGDDQVQVVLVVCAVLILVETNIRIGGDERLGAGVRNIARVDDAVSVDIQKQAGLILEERFNDALEESHIRRIDDPQTIAGIEIEASHEILIIKCVNRAAKLRDESGEFEDIIAGHGGVAIKIEVLENSLNGRDCNTDF